jgi:integrase
VSGRRPNGEGTIYERRDGRWEGAAYVLLPSGGRARKRVYGKTRAEVFAKLAELQQKSRSGLPAISGQLTMATYLDEWLEMVAKPSVRPSTFYSYRLYVEDHLIPALGKKRLARLTPTDVRAFVQAKTTAGLAPATVKQMHAILRAALQHAMREDLVARNVAKLVVVPGGSQGEIVPLSVEEARALLSAAEGTRLYALWAVALAVGLRRGEALGLRWKDVDLDLGELRVSQTLQRVDGQLQIVPPKSERSRRRVPLPSVTVAALKRHRMQAAAEAAKRGGSVGPEDLVFTSSIGTPLEPRNANRVFTDLLRSAGLRPTRLLSRPGAQYRCCHRSVSPGRSPNPPCQFLGNGLSTVAAVRRGAWVAMGLGFCGPGRCSETPLRLRSGSTQSRPLRSATARWGW